MFRKFHCVAMTTILMSGVAGLSTGCVEGAGGGLLEGGLAGALLGGGDDDAQRNVAPAPAAPAPAAPAPTVLLQQTVGIAQVGFPGGSEFFQFNPIAVGRPVTVRVSGDVTGSRPAISVFDTAINIVVNEDNPLTNTSTATFIPNAVGTHFMFFQEFGGPASLYTVTVTQQ